MLTLVIVSYNSASVMLRHQHEVLSSGRYPVIVVDNASTDGSADRIRRAFPAVQVEVLERNRGYGGAANVGIRMATTCYVLLLNPDLQLSAPAIDDLLGIARAADETAAIFAPAMRVESIQAGPPVEKEWVLGAAMLFDTWAMKDVGWFDEQFFLFYEEKDLCLRARQQGKKVLYCPAICFPHLKGQSTEPSLAIEHLKQWHVGWSSQYYFAKHGLAIGKRRPWRMFLQYTFRSLTAMSGRKRRKYRARSEGILAFARGLSAFHEDGRPRGISDSP